MGRIFVTTNCLDNGMPVEDVSELPVSSNFKNTAIYGEMAQIRL